MGRSPRSAPYPRLLPFPAALAAACAALLLVLPSAASAQIRINEIYPDPAGVDDPLERIEIYNAGNTAIDVTGWGIHDAASIDGNPAIRCRLPEDFDSTLCSGNPVIQPGEFRVVKATTLVAWLNQGGDDVYLCSNRTQPPVIVHQVTYPSSTGHTDQVWAALPNGSSNFDWRTLSLCGTNGTLGDVVPPATVADLAAAPGAFPGEIRLSWTAPGDDGATGTASIYQIKVSHVPLTAGTFAAAADLDRWLAEPVPAAGGAPETLLVSGFDPDSTWYFAIETQDEVPNTSGVSNSPGTAPLAGVALDPNVGLTPYFGNLHSHTSYSDGVDTPPVAWNFARNLAPTPLDFLAVTDHNHVAAGMDSVARYHRGLSQAAAANDDGNFVAIWGQEWGIIGSGGHANVFEAPVLFGWDPGVYDVFVAEGDYTGLYTALLANPPASYPPIVEWCHPVSGDFNNFALTDDAKSVVRLMAVVSGPAFSTSVTESDVGNTGYDNIFQDALRKGFRVSPTGDGDNHNATWGASSESRTAVLATAKTKSSILGAMAARRTYATQDHNAVVNFSANGHAMGDVFTAPSGIRIAVEVTDPDAGDSVSQIELFRGITGTSNAVRVAFNTGNARFDWRETAAFTTGTEAHYYLRIRMADNQNIWTGPVYVTYDPNSTVAVGEGPASSPRLALAANPNPARGGVTAAFTLPRPVAHASLQVYDLSGRVVRSLVSGPLAAGEHRVAWDGRWENGTPARSGVFFLRLQSGAGGAASKFLLLR